MNFNFNSSIDSDFYRSMTGLIKSNNGFFRSTKQRWFVRNKSMYPWGYIGLVGQSRPTTGISAEEAEKAKAFFGVEMAAGQWLYMPSATVRWAAGTRARRDVEWAFVVDDYGVVRKYRLHRAYNTSGTASGINVAKTKLEWERPADSVLPADLIEEPKKEEAVEPGNHVGKVGKREVFELTVDFVKNLGWKSVAYGAGYESWLVVAHDKDGNIVKMFGGFGESVNKGEVIKVKATVKDHTYYKGRCETIVNRCKAC